MKVKDILPDCPIKDIQVRTNDPWGGDMLFGYCHWTGESLVSGDGDSYYLEEEIYKYEYDEENNYLTYWIISEWK